MEWLNTHRTTILRLEEHEVFPEPGTIMSMFDDLKSRLEYTIPTQSLPELKLLGMDCVPHQHQLMMSYFIGADWIDRKQDIAIEVLPKIHGIDFQSMLMKCFEHEESCKNIEDILLIRDDDKEICLPATDFQLEPFIIITFLSLVERIMLKGLKSNFITREERLNGKIKGKILTSRYFKHGFANGHKEHIDCRYDEYSIDCRENQVLKAALLVIRRMMSDEKNIWSKDIFSNTQEKLHRCLSAFNDVSDITDIRNIRSIHLSPMFVDYRSAIRMAQIIIDKQGVGISQQTDDGYQLVPPFIINMSLLFERYVLALMIDVYGAKAIKYQEGTYGNIPDFLKPDEQLIMDTKYIPLWDEQNITDNIRQLSGYGRSVGIRCKLGIKDEQFTCPCLIIYPNIDGTETFEDFKQGFLACNESGTSVTSIKEYQKFYKVAVKLPVI